MKRNIDNRHNFFIIIVISIAFLIRIIGLGDESFWLDEALTLPISSVPWSSLWLTSNDPTPPLYYSIIKLILNYGDSEFLIRLPSVIFNTLTIFIIFKSAHLLFGFKAALLTSLSLTFSTLNIEYAQEARAFALLELAISVAFYGMVRLNHFHHDNNKITSFYNFLKYGGILYFLGSLIALYSHTTGLFFIIGVQLYFFSLYIIDKNKFHNFIKYWLIINFLIFLIFFPNFYIQLEAANKYFNWLKQVDLYSFIYTTYKVHSPFYNIHYEVIRYGPKEIDLILFCIVFLGAYQLKKNIDTFLLISLLLISSFLFPWLLGFVHTPTFMARTILWGTLFSSLLIGYAFSKLNHRVFVISAAIYFILLGKNFANYKLNDQDRQEWRQSVNYISEKANQNDLIIVCASYTIVPFSYYARHTQLNNSRIYGWDKNKNILYNKINYYKTYPKHGSNFKQQASLQKVMSENQNIWILQSHCNNEEFHKISDQLNLYEYEEIDYKKYKGVNIFLYKKEII